MLRTIDKQFNKCGIKELVSAARLGEKGTIKTNLKGGDVKEGILLHKKFFEALLRPKVACFSKSQMSRKTPFLHLF